MASESLLVWLVVSDIRVRVGWVFFVRQIVFLICEGVRRYALNGRELALRFSDGRVVLEVWVCLVVDQCH